MNTFVKDIVIPSCIGAFLVIAFNSLSSCTDTKPTGKDGYKFGSKQYELNDVQVEVKTYQTYRALQKAAVDSDKTLKDAKDIAAFSVINPSSNTCTIHMIDPTVNYEPEFVGHEFLHCVYGQWHTDNDSKS